MIDFKQKLIQYWKQLKAWYPTRLPISDDELDSWSKDILETYGWPVNDSFRWTISIMIMHMKAEGCFRKPKRYFGMRLHRSAANQVADALMRELKAKQLQQQAEATAKAKELADAANVTQTTTQAV